jgi:riboflavin kinase/FMN adenylyltransferase
MSVDLIAYLRGEAKFDSVEALKAQMAADCRMARRLLSERDGVPSLT